MPYIVYLFAFFTPVQFMVDSVPREEADYASLYKTFLTRDTLLPLNCFDSRVGEAPRCRLPFPPEQSGFSWASRLERAREELPKAVFRPTRPKIYKRTASSEGGNTGNQNVTVLALEVPTKRGRGRPKKESTVLVDAAAVNRSSFFVKRTYKVNEDEDPGTSVGIHTLENYTLHGHGGADVNVGEIGIVRPDRHYLRDNTRINYCEYDLDDQDVEWLKLVKSSSFTSNGPDSSNSNAILTENVMEKVIEELELGWNVLTQPLRKLQQRKEAAMYPDEVPCEICGDCDTSNCNVIVLCDDCDLAVHQECYGVPHIPEGPWLCRPCSEKKSAAFDFKAKCMLCPWPGGALRKTTDHRWVHSLCAHLVPETAITFSPNDPYDLVDVCTLQADRAKLKCVLCRGDPKCTSASNGYPIQCSSKLCHVAFHPMCARVAGWNVDYTNQRSFCNKHAPEESGPVDIDEPKLKLRLTLGVSNNNSISPMLSPTKSKYPSVSIEESCPLHVTREGEKLRIPAFAPKVLVDQICEKESVFESSDIPETLRRPIVIKIAKYWQLKRESRRGTPLLKSLQLDAGWSQTDSMSEEAFSREWTEKVALIRSLKCLKRKADLLRRRELAKLESLQSSMEIFEILSSPFSKILCKLVQKLQREVDAPGYFAYPVPCDLFPDYPLIVKYPMDFSTIMKNLRSDLMDNDKNELFYPDLLHFYADLKLIWENSRLYNTRTSVFYQAADRLEMYSKALLKQIWGKFKCFDIEGPFDILNLSSKTKANEINPFEDSEDLLDLPKSSPERFPKATITSILSSEDSINSMKRRGRPPKKRDNVTSGSGSIDSIVSNEEGNAIKTHNNNNNAVKIPKKRGRPPKKQSKTVEDEPEEEESDEKGAVIVEQDDSKDVFDDYLDSPPKAQKPVVTWVHLKSGSWCPGEILPNPARSRRTDCSPLVNVKLFDNVGTTLSVPHDSLKPLTEDFESDIEALKIEGIVSRKFLSTAHRSALERIN